MSISNVKISEVDTAVLGAELARLELTAASDDPAVMVKALEDYYEPRFEGAGIEFVICDTCGGASDDKLEVCPYCGDGEPVDTEAATHATEDSPG